MYVLYNPMAGNGHGKEKAREIEQKVQGQKMEYRDITRMDAADFLASLPMEETVVLAGGDGTLNHFINRYGSSVLNRPVYYFPAGSGNDFWNDVGQNSVDGMILLNDYLKQLPVVEVKGKKSCFLNGVGYGIDGYCCETGDRLRIQGKENVNYTAIAIKGLLFHYKPVSAKVTVDGVSHCYRHVWLAPTMNGRYYGGGMEVAPEQDRLNPAGKVAVVVLHCPSKLKTLVVFPSIFKGEHVKHTEMVEVLSGSEITVAFDRPTALQIDGETVTGVTEYSVVTDAAKENAARQTMAG